MRTKILLAPAALACSLALSACGTVTSTSSFKGTEHEVAQVIANLQSATTAAENGKICSDYLAAAVVSKLGGHKGCEQAIKHQLAQVDNLEMKIESVKVAPGGKRATVRLKSEYSGNKKSTELPLVEEGGAWRLSGP